VGDREAPGDILMRGSAVAQRDEELKLRLDVVAYVTKPHGFSGGFFTEISPVTLLPNWLLEVPVDIG